MIERWKAELELVKVIHGAIELSPDNAWLIHPRWPVPAGWNRSETPLLVLRPAGYPVTPPDNFFVDADLRLASGTMPGNAGHEVQAGRNWLKFSYHVESGDWKPHADLRVGHNLVTFLEGVARRFREVS